MNYTPPCEVCGNTEFTWADKQFGCCRRKLQTFRQPHSHRNQIDYREDLARFPNDPQAFVDGPTALGKLMDQRKREGWTFRALSDAAPKDPKDEGKNLMAEAFEAAKAKNFKFDEEL